MKKIILTGGLAFAVLFSTTVNAQDSSSSENEKQYGPTAGSWGIGINANPLLVYFGNFFGKTTTNPAPVWNNLTQDNQIIGRYFLEDNLAIRGKFRFGFLGAGETNMVVNRSIDQSAVGFPNLLEDVENTWKHSDYDFGLAGGLEWRTDFNRLNLLYGVELGFGFSGESDKYTYGNDLAPTATIPVTVTAADAMNSGDNISPAGATYGTVARALSYKHDKQFLIGLRGFFGIEYFILPKISIVGEFGWGVAYATAGQSKLKYESIGLEGSSITPSVAEIEEVGSKKNGGFGATEIINSKLFGTAGTISINFYF